MISIVLYGRNDSYGYNLHKRAALSLNCMAEVLTDPNDEILFVDYNTPNDFPTFPEAICDTLTEKARRILRVLRIRPEVHDALFGDKTHLKALEPVARNAAVRRSNPANRWILSTNTDMIFVLRNGLSLSEAVANLPRGFYCAPRFEAPETLWESFDRRDPAAVIAEIRELGESLHLNEIVKGADTILYDAPGDFQLIERGDIFALSGFHEGMLLGWHVDSNMSKRLTMLHGAVGDAAPFVFGYHCDHTRQTTPAHAHRSPENSFRTFVDEVSRLELPEQEEIWGLASVDLEEIRLTNTVNTTYRQVLKEVISKPLLVPTVATYRPDSYDREIVSTEHVLPFLVDLFANAHRDTVVAWLGPQDRIYELFTACWRRLGFRKAVIALDDSLDDAKRNDAIDAFVINFGVPELVKDEAAVRILQDFNYAIGLEIDHYTKGQPFRQIIGVNAVHNHFETMFTSLVRAARTPFSARLRHGYLLKDALEPRTDWTGLMRVGSAGEKHGDGIVSNGLSGHLCFGPYQTLLPGNYNLDVELETPTAVYMQMLKMRPAVIEVVQSEEVLLSKRVWLARGINKISLSLLIAKHHMNSVMQVRVKVPKRAAIRLRRVVVNRTKPAEQEDTCMRRFHGV